MPPSLCKELREYFVYYEAASMTLQEQDMLSMLSPGLRGKVARAVNAPLLRRVPFFESADEECIVAMTLELVPALFAPNEIIIVQGHTGSELYIVQSGEVLIFMQNLKTEAGTVDVTELATLSKGDFFGELGLARRPLRAAPRSPAKCTQRHSP